jgi:hypothetical protein
MTSPRGLDWTNFDLEHDRLLNGLGPEEPDRNVEADYVRWLSQAHRHEETREWAKKAVESDSFGRAPKTFQFAMRCALARSYFFDSWRTAQRGLFHLRALKGLAVGRREICEAEALMAECLSLHGLPQQALRHSVRAVEIAEGLGGATLSLRQTDYAITLLRAGSPGAALKILPLGDSDGAVEFAARAMAMSEIQSALGRFDRSEHWRELAETTIERERLHGRFRLCPKIMAVAQ